ncbi:Endonuclease/exonuclease/phosphatase [Mrakia frigida]|uniref:Endonuclease/exonuclease/phosphatase n=1 Tax=Mrakia frigida TaxID=29902 RepID=UPI003FCC0E40
MDGAKKDSDSISIMCWNVSSLEAIMQNEEASFFEFIDQSQPDMIVLQNHKVPPPPDIPRHFISPFDDRGYVARWWNNAAFPFPIKGMEDVGHLGVVIMSRCRVPILSMQLLMSGDGSAEGRLMLVELDSFILIGTLFPEAYPPPAAGASEAVCIEQFETLQVRAKWHKRLREVLPKLDSVKPVIIAGSFSVDLDQANARDRTIQVDGFEACGRLGKVLQSSADRTQPFVDALKALIPPQPINVDEPLMPVLNMPETYNHPDPTRAGSGNRYDGFLVSSRLMSRVQECWVHTDQKGTLHKPVVLELGAVRQ